MAAINGFDSFGHYLRARLILNTCSRYYTEPVDGCSSRFASAGATSSSATRRLGRRHRPDPAPHHRRAAGQGPRQRRAAARDDRDAAAREDPGAGGQTKTKTKPQSKPAPAAEAPAAPQQQTTNTNEGEAVLDYLFGKDAG